MAINSKDYESIDTGIKLHYDNTKVLVDIVSVEWHNGKKVQKRKRKVLDITKRVGWTRRDYKSEAKLIGREYINPLDGIKIDEGVTVQDLFDEYMRHYPEKAWKDTQKYTFNKHIKPYIGQKAAVDVKRYDVDRIITRMRESGLKPRTQKLVLNVLRPVFTYAIQNEILRSDPTKNIIIKLPKTKKYVDDPVETFRKIWDAVNKEFYEQPYYKALFYFALLHGRRKGEILGLRWSNVNFEAGKYTIMQTKSGEDQTYTLPEIIADELIQIPTFDQDIVFISPVPDKNKNYKQLVDIRYQTEKIKAASGLNNFGLHYCRNVLVSLMAEQGASATFLSGVLGHTDINTINKYLTMPRRKASEAAIDVVAEVLK